jgi:germination protein M
VKRLVLLVAFTALFVATSCGTRDETTATDTETAATDTETATEGPPATTEVRVYWLRNGKVWPAHREVQETDAVATTALEELLAGPTADEDAELSFTTAIPDETEIEALTIEDGVAEVDLSGELNDEGWAQLVYTLTQFPTVRSVDLAEGDYVLFTRFNRADFEDQTPAILVESPLPFEDGESPLRVRGTANTFEADFQYELTDTDGRIVDENFVKATSGTGTRGTFDFTTDEFTVPFDGIGSLIVFESSARDGSRINLVEIPLRMSK